MLAGRVSKTRMRFNQQSVDPRVLEIDHHHGQYERNRFIAVYHNLILRLCARMSGVRPGMRVLDYGCGKQMLKKHLPAGVDYVGYDLEPAFSDITDPSKDRYDAVFAIQMLMYPDELGLRELTSMFANVTGRVVVMMPAQGFIKRRVLDPILGLKEAADSTFRSTPKTAYAALSGKFDCARMWHLFGIADISLWRLRDT